MAYYRGYCRERLGRSGARRLPARVRSLHRLRLSRTVRSRPRCCGRRSRRTPVIRRRDFSWVRCICRAAWSQEAVEEWEQCAAGRRPIPYAPPQPRVRMVLRAAPAGPRRSGPLRRCCRRSREQGRVRGFGCGDEPARSPRRRRAWPCCSATRTWPALLRSSCRRSRSHWPKPGGSPKQTRLFANRFFPREEGSTDLQRAALEVKLQRARTLAERNDCEHAMAALRQMRDAPPLAGFTAEGVRSLLASAPVRDRDSTDRRSLRRARRPPGPDWRRCSDGPAERAAVDVADAYEAATLMGPVDPAAWRAALESAERRAAALMESGAGSLRPGRARQRPCASRAWTRAARPSSSSGRCSCCRTAACHTISRARPSGDVVRRAGSRPAGRDGACPTGPAKRGADLRARSPTVRRDCSGGSCSASIGLRHRVGGCPGRLGHRRRRQGRSRRPDPSRPPRQLRCGTARRVRLFGARNEIVAFQVIVEADGDGIRALSVALPELRSGVGRDRLPRRRPRIPATPSIARFSSSPSTTCT